MAWSDARRHSAVGMACFSPIDAWQLEDGRVIFVERGPITRPLKLPCGQCVGCRLERSRMWAVRCMHEAQMHEHSSFITLTYDREFLPVGGSLVYGDFQRFLKRLRKKKGQARFYMCGEYGELSSRPHFHALLFGVFFHDREYLRVLPSGGRLYRSAELEALWPFGYSSVGDVTFESAAYVARYIMKKITGDDALDHYMRVDPTTGEVYQLEPEFSHMSLKPGIGGSFFSKFRAEMFPRDFCISRGLKVKPPKYYKGLLKAVDGFVNDEVEYERFRRSIETIDDSSLQRLAVREEVAKARLKFLKRGLEL